MNTKAGFCNILGSVPTNHGQALEEDDIPLGPYKVSNTFKTFRCLAKGNLSDFASSRRIFVLEEHPLLLGYCGLGN